MEFCPRCGSILIQKRKNLGCSRCNYATKGKTARLKTSEKIEGKKEIPIISERDSQILPVIVETCKKCGNDKAYFWTIQTRAGDEAETKFFKCTKCSHTWREYR